VVLAGEALSHAGGAAMGEGRAVAARAIDSGEALERFRRMVEAQGGDARVVDDPLSVLPRAPVERAIEADRGGTVVAVNAEAIGRQAVALGAGRLRRVDPVDPATGLVLRAKIGDRLEVGMPIGAVHARTEDAAERAARVVLEALQVADEPASSPQLVQGWFDSED
jgi:thymidine phosphorylase